MRMRGTDARRVLGGLIVTLALGWCAAVSADPVLKLVSRSGGASADGPSQYPIFSPDGRSVLYGSAATSFSALSTRGDLLFNDLWRFDFEDNPWSEVEWKPVSAPSGGVRADGDSGDASFSPDGRYVAFTSEATNLVDPPAPAGGLYLRDTAANTTTRLAVNGAYPNAPCYRPRWAGNGTLTFVTTATNLGYPNPGKRFYRYDPLTGNSTYLPLTANPDQTPDAIHTVRRSLNGRFLCFNAIANFLGAGDGLAHCYLWDTFKAPGAPGQVQLVDAGAAGVPGNAGCSQSAVSGDGRYVVFTSGATNLLSSDTNGFLDVFLRDMQTGQLRVVSKPATGQGNNHSMESVITPDGRYVAFSSRATNLVPGVIWQRSVIFRADMQAPVASRLSAVVPPGGIIPNDYMDQPDISADGQRLTFRSNASNLVANDNNGVPDVFVYYRMDETSDAPATVRPAPMATNCPRRQTVTATFTRDVDQSSAEQHFALYTPTGALVVGTFAWPQANRTMVFTPTSCLNKRTAYRPAIAKGVLRLNGTKYSQGQQWYFSTGNQPGVTQWSPQATNVAAGAVITVTFDRRMNIQSVKRKFSLAPKTAGALVFDATKTTVTFTPNAPLTPSTTYTVRVGADVQAADGEALGMNFRWDFVVGGAAAPGGSLVASATRGGQVQLNLQSRGAATATVAILNLAGRTVAVLPESPIEAGTNTLLWGRRTRTGVTAPTGQYLVRVTLRSPAGQTATLVTGLHLP